jgi:hypothetical protein
LKEDPGSDTRREFDESSGKSARGGEMSDDRRPEDAEDVEAQLLKESLGAGLAAAAIFAGSTQAASYPVPSPPGASDAAAELALVPKRGEATRAIQQAKGKAVKAKAAKAKAKKRPARVGTGGRAQPH